MQTRAFTSNPLLKVSFLHWIVCSSDFALSVWDAIAICTKSVLAESGTLKEQVKGIGFDTTCSLVVCDISGAPVAVSPSANSPEHDIILWCDHRATEEAAFINATGSHTLKYMGGSVSLSNRLQLDLIYATGDT